MVPVPATASRCASCRPSRPRPWAPPGSTGLSNIGRVPDVFTFGSAADQLWASPPAPMPRGLSVGAATYRGRLHLTVRHRHTLLDVSAAEQFATILAGHVHDLAAEIAA